MKTLSTMSQGNSWIAGSSASAKLNIQVKRFKNGWPLTAEEPMSDWYLPTGKKGYTDYSRHL